VAGKDTIGSLDDLLFKASSPPPPAPPLSPPPTTREYQLGTGDPPHGHDPGAGIWNSRPKEAAYVTLKASILSGLAGAYIVVGDDATKHMAHYFQNSGLDYTIDLEGMVAEVPSAKERYEDEVAQMQEFVEKLAAGNHAVTSRQAEVGYNEQGENRNWYFAVGGYSSWGRGAARVQDGPSGRLYEVDFEYRFFDRYNWDKGKSVTLAGITITDQFMGEFHRQGLAKEFNCFGSFKRRFTWKKGEAIARSQMHPSGGRGG
jgi:hypothetical protein